MSDDRPTDRPSATPIFTARDLGAFLSRTRIERGLTQQELAELLGVSRRYLYEIEEGKPGLYTDRLFTLLRLLGVRLTARSDPSGGVLLD